MTYKEIIDKAAADRKIKKADLARKLGTIPQILNDWINKSKTMPVDRLITIMDALGYDVVIKDRINGEEEVLTK